MKLLYAIVFMVSTSMNAKQSSECQPRVLIFDLGGIFLNVSQRGYLFRLGIGTLTGYAFFDRQNPFNLSRIVFRTLDQVPLRCDLSFKKTYRHNGEELPYIVCAWQAGLLTSCQAAELSHETITRLSAESFFTCKREELLVRRTVDTMFNPRNHAQLTYCYKGPLNLLKEISKQRNPDGSKKFKLVALSNWDKDSFAYVKQKFDAELAPFDAIYISGDIQSIKPNDAAFDAVIKRCCENKEYCIFIDDQPENVAAGKAYGFGKSILYKNNSMGLAALRSDLECMAILPKRRSLIQKLTSFFLRTGS